MELKFDNKQAVTHRFGRSNRTFMELKSYYYAMFLYVLEF